MPLITGLRSLGEQMRRILSLNNLIRDAFVLALGRQFVTDLATSGGELHKMIVSLQAVTGSAEEFERVWDRIMRISRLPGLGVEQAAKGFQRLMGSGMTMEGAERMMRALSNAIIVFGGTSDDMEHVTRAFQQMVSKGRLASEEIRQQIAEFIPNIFQLIQRAFGTADIEALSAAGVTPTRFIEGIIAEMEKMPRVADSVENALKNFSQSARLAFQSAGLALVNSLLPHLRQVTAFLRFIVASDLTGLVAKGMKEVGASLSGRSPVVSTLAWLIAAMKVFAEQIPIILQRFGAVFDALRRHALLFISILLAPTIFRSLQMMVDLFIKLRQTLAGITSLSALIAILLSKGKAIPLVLGTIATSAALFAGLEKLFSTGGLPRVLGLSEMMDRIEKERAAMLKGFEKSDFAAELGKAAPLAEPALQTPFFRPEVEQAQKDMAQFGKDLKDPLSKMQSHLASIDSSTSSMAKSLDLRRIALGGKARGEIGVTPVEIAAISTQRGLRNLSIRIEGGGSLDRLIEDVILQTVMKLRLAGEF